MAINQNHTFEDLDGIKCSIVEKNASRARVEFLQPLLEYNGYKVVVVKSPPPKGAAVPDPEQPGNPENETYTIGVTDVRFNATNAVFGRLLRTDSGKVVTLAYWQQQDVVPDPSVPYYAQPS
ncbi:MAG TPA: hypothetical protein PLU53_07020 [Bacteroidia bacterium]|nr:hypothetical protein [Bacteroidia bacterium]